MNVPFVVRIELKECAPLDKSVFPGNLAFARDLDLEFDSPVTFFVGENGSGKSTLLEAMAVLSRLPISGGGMNETGANHASVERSILADSLRLRFIRQPQDRYFFRAETQAHFASLLERRKDDPDFLDSQGAPADPYQQYGGRSLHKMSHGEAFLSIINNRFQHGLLLMDEPESALSPQRQLALLALMHDLARNHDSQFFVATHSPILLTYPGATIISFDSDTLERIALEDTTHYRITRGVLTDPGMYWHHLTASSNAEYVPGSEPDG